MNGWQHMIAGEEVKVAELRRIYALNRSRAEFPREVAALLEQLDSDIVWRAVWLMCRLAEAGALGDRELEVLAGGVDGSRHWAWRLMVCQLFSRCACPVSRREDVFPFLQDCLHDRRVIVRAWALTALWQFRDDQRFRAKILAARREAEEDAGKAMVARLRRLGGRKQSARPHGARGRRGAKVRSEKSVP